MDARNRGFNLEGAGPAIRHLASLRNAKIAEYQRLRSRSVREPSGSGVPATAGQSNMPSPAEPSSGQHAASAGRQHVDLEGRVISPSASMQELLSEIEDIESQLEQFETDVGRYRQQQEGNRQTLQSSRSACYTLSAQSSIDEAIHTAQNDVRLSDSLLRLIKKSCGQVGRELYRTAPPAYETANKLYSDQLPEDLQSDTSGRGDYVDETLAMLAAYTHDDSDDRSERPTPGLGDSTDRSDDSLTGKLYLGRAYAQNEPHQERFMLLPPAHGHLRSGGYSLNDRDGRYTLFPGNPY